MRILLVQPAPFEDTRLGLENTAWMSEPVALTSIAAMARPGDEVEILDLRCEPSSALPRRLREFRPDVVATTSMTTDAYQAQAILRTTRGILPSATTVIGGHHPTLMPEFFREPFVDGICKGEGEEVFQQLLDAVREHPEKDNARLVGIQGLEVNLNGTFQDQGKSAWVKDLDALPAPSRHLIKKYAHKYFFIAAQPMASIFTSRGCSFDCNFCAIWEFYDRKVRYLSAKVIADRMEACEEDIIFLLDDNFLTNANRLWALVEELESRNIKKFWMTQGRADFVVRHPDLIKRLAGVGMAGLLSGYESNAEDALKQLRKRATVNANVEAARILKENGVIPTGIFMVRPEFTAADFKDLYDYILDLGIAIPLVTIQTPLPGTELWRRKRDKLLTEDFRLFDISHAVVPTRLPRKQFYAEFVKWKRVIDGSVKRWFTPRRMMQRPRLYRLLFRGMPHVIRRRLAFNHIQFNANSYLRDEEGIIPVDAILAPDAAPPLNFEELEAAK
jgi:hopanoid C-3 methylase